VARVLVIHRDAAEAVERAARLRAGGFEAEPYTSPGSKGFRGIRANPPDAILIDLTQLPSYGKYMGALLREQKSLRAIPLVFIEGDPEKAAQVRAILPDAVYTPWAKAGAAIHRAMKRAPAEPMAPIPPHRPLLSKLGIGEASGVALLHAPKDFRLAEGGWRRAQPDRADIVMAFYQSAAGLGRELPLLAGMMRKGLRLWVVWPKKAGAAAGDLTMLRIREMAQAYGLTDYKVCAVDDKWSGMALGQRRTIRREPL
jgi:CheY-like chemotaxis protein